MALVNTGNEEAVGEHGRRRHRELTERCPAKRRVPRQAGTAMVEGPLISETRDPTETETRPAGGLLPSTRSFSEHHFFRLRPRAAGQEVKRLGLVREMSDLDTLYSLSSSGF